MIKKLLSLGLALSLFACGGNGSSGNSTTKKYYQAKNIIFNSAMSSAIAADIEIDTTTVIGADQVLLENGETSLNSTNVQDAFNETQPDLNTIIVSTWTLTLIDHTTCSELEGFDTFTCDIGQLTFSDDGTFTVDSFTYGHGVLGLIPVFGTEGETSIVKASFQIIENSILASTISTLDEGSIDVHTDKQAYVVVKMTPLKIVTSSFILTKKVE